MIDAYKNISLINCPVTIQDIVITGNHAGEAGEYNDAFAELATQKNRLYKHIEFLVKIAAKEHLSRNFDNSHSMKKEKSNVITRLVTNEFAFYTRKPLSISDFNELQQWINTLAKKLPQNLHLVLSSFAVKTPNNKVMNVVALIECGIKPKLSLIVKNALSSIDPVYFETIEDCKVILPNVCQKDDQIDSYKINIDGQSIPFSFKNVIVCETRGGSKFLLCIEICLDNFLGVGKKQLEIILKNEADISRTGLLPSQCSHIVTSNAISLCSKYSIGTVTHADPVYWRREIKEGAQVLQAYKIKTTFGLDLKVFITSPTLCSNLPSYEQSLLDTYNKKALNATRSFVAGIKSVEKLSKPLPPKSKTASKVTVRRDKSLVQAYNNKTLNTTRPITLCIVEGTPNDNLKFPTDSTSSDQFNLPLNTSNTSMLETTPKLVNSIAKLSLRLANT